MTSPLRALSVRVRGISLNCSIGLLLEDGLYRDGVALSRTKAFWEFGAYNSPRPTRTEDWDERGRVKATTYSYDPASGSFYN
jgi:hypothetical protein